MITTLGEHLTRGPRYGIGAAAVPYSAHLPTYIRITDIDEFGRFRPTPPVSVDSPLSGNYVLQEGDLVIARTGASVGKSYRYQPSDGQLVFAGFLVAIRPDRQRLDPRYLGYVLQTKRYWDWIASESMRSGQPGVNAQQIARFELELPSIKDQRAIATALADVDALIERLEALITKKQNIKIGMMQDLLAGRRRLAGFTAPWREVGLLDAMTISSGQVDPRLPDYRDLPLIAPDHIESGTGRLRTVETAAEQSAISGKYTVEPGDVIYSKIRPYLRKAYLAEFRALCSADMYPLRPKPDVDPNFVLNTLLSERFTDFAVSASMRSGIPKINRAELAGYRFAAPAGREQMAIGEVLQDADVLLNTLARRLQAARAVKSGMMQELLTGRTRLPQEAAS